MNTSRRDPGTKKLGSVIFLNMERVTLNAGLKSELPANLCSNRALCPSCWKQFIGISGMIKEHTVCDDCPTIKKQREKGGVYTAGL